MAKNSFIFNAEFKKLETALSQVIAELNSFGDNLKTTTKDVKKLSKAYKGVSDKVDEGKDKIKDNKKAHKDLAKTGKKDLNGLEKFWRELNKEVSVALGRISKYTALYKAFRFITDSIVEQVKAFVTLNDSFLDIARVADLTIGEVKDLQEVTLDLAAAYGVASAESAGIAKIWTQQGKRGEELASLIRQTAVAVSALGISSQEASEALTILQRVFQITPDVLETYIDKIKAVESQNAVTTRFLVQAYTKIGVAANNVGVDIDSLNGLLTTLGETTRQSGSYVGNFFKVAFARLQRPAVIKYLEEINVLNGKNITTFNTMEDRLDIIANAWGRLNDVQRFNIAELAGGLRRYQDFVTLMDNYDRSLKVTADSVKSFGSAQAAVEKRMQQMGAQANALQSEFSKMLTAMGAPELLRSSTRGLSKLSGLIGILGDSMGNLSNTAKLSATGLTALAATFLTVKGILVSTVPTFALIAGGISAVTFGLSALGFAFEDSEDAMKRNASELSNIISGYKEAEKSAKNLSEAISRKLILRLQNVRDAAEGQDLLSALFSVAGRKDLELTVNEVERFNKVLNDVQAGNINIQSVESLISDIITRSSDLTGKLAKQLSSINGISEDVASGLVKKSQKWGRDYIKILRDQYKEYKELVRDMDKADKAMRSMGGYDTSPKEMRTAMRTYDMVENRIKELVTEIEQGNGVKLYLIPTITDALAKYVNVAKEAQAESDVIANLVSGKGTEIKSGAIQLLRDYAETIRNLDQTLSGTDLRKQVEDFSKSTELPTSLAERLFGDQADFDKNRQEYISNTKQMLGTLGASYNKFFNDIQKQGAVDFLSGQFTDTRGLREFLQTNIEALEISKKQGAENEAQLKRLKLINQIEAQRAEAQRLLEDATLGLTSVQKEQLKTVIERSNIQLKSLNDENSKINESIKLWAKLNEKQKESSRLSQLESGLMNRIKSARTSVEAESMLLEAKLKGVNVSERELKLQLAIAEAEKDGLDVSELKKALNDANLTSQEKYNKSLQKTITLRNDLKTGFADILTSIPERIRDAASSFDDVNAGLSSASEDYRVAVNALQEAERQFNATGLSQYQNAMESAREDVQKTRDAYNEMVEQSKELNNQANITKQLFGDILDLLRDKLLDKFTEQLISDGGILDGIAGWGAGSSGSGVSKKDGLNKKDVKEGTESGQLKAAPTVGKIISNALISASLFQGNKSAQTGSAIGSILSNFVNPKSLIGAAGGIVGGLVGGLFKSSKKTYAVPDLSIPNIPDIVKNTDAIIENTSEIQKLNTNLINAPAGFSLPALPSLSGGQQSINIQNLNLSGVNDLDSLEGRIAESLRRQLITG